MNTDPYQVRPCVFLPWRALQTEQAEQEPNWVALASPPAAHQRGAHGGAGRFEPAARPAHGAPELPGLQAVQPETEGPGRG